MALKCKFYEVGERLMAWLSPHSEIANLGLKSFEYHRQLQAEPTFPCDPGAMLPRAYLRALTADEEMLNTLGCVGALVIYRYSIWFQSLQVADGRNHQAALFPGIVAFKNPILAADFRPELGVPGFEMTSVAAMQTVIHDESVHQLGSPRVSNAELNITITGKIRDDG